MGERTEYQIVKWKRELDGPWTWSVVRTTKDGPTGERMGAYAHEWMAQLHLRRLVDPNADLPDPNPELYTVKHELKWI